MHSDGLVSIVIVAYNNWPDLELSIQSALHQSYPRIEVIVVDNSSRDATEQQVKGLFGGRIKYVRQPNSGEGGGRNTGMRLAAGEFIQFLDGDDILAPDKIEKQVATFREAPDVDVVYGDVRQFQSGAGPAKWEDWDTQDYEDMLATLLSAEGKGAGLLPDSVIFRRRALDLVGPWTENSPNAEVGGNSYIGSDQDYWLRAAWLGCRFRYCPGSMCFHRRRSNQLSSNPQDLIRGMETVYLRAHSYICRDPYRSAVSRRLGQVLFFLAISETEVGRRASFERLRKAREVSPEFVTPPAFAMGAVIVALGIGPLVLSRWLRPIRRLVAKFAGIRKS